MSVVPHTELTQQERWLLNGLGAVALDREPDFGLRPAPGHLEAEFWFGSSGSGHDLTLVMLSPHRALYLTAEDDRAVANLRSREDGYGLAVTLLRRELDSWEEGWR